QRFAFANEWRMIGGWIAVIIANQSVVADISCVAFPNRHVLGSVSEDDEIKTKRGSEGDDKPKPDTCAGVPALLSLCHVENCRAGAPPADPKMARSEPDWH